MKNLNITTNEVFVQTAAISKDQAFAKLSSLFGVGDVDNEMLSSIVKGCAAHPVKTLTPAGISVRDAVLAYNAQLQKVAGMLETAKANLANLSDPLLATKQSEIDAQQKTVSKLESMVSVPEFVTLTGNEQDGYTVNPLTDEQAEQVAEGVYHLEHLTAELINLSNPASDATKEAQAYIKRFTNTARNAMVSVTVATITGHSPTE